MSIYEYDQEEHIRMEREDAFEDGRKALLVSQVRAKLAKNKTLEVIAEELEQDVHVIRQIAQEMGN